MTPVSSLDVYPTLLELAGLEMRAELDGALLAELSGAGALDREELFWHFPCYTAKKPASAVRAGNWKLVLRYEERASSTTSMSIRARR